MKKYVLGLIISALMIGVIPAMMPVSVGAQTKYVARVVDRKGRVRWVPVKNPSYYRRHRNRINMAIGTGGGAILGGLIGGKKGAVIGGGLGLGSSTLYTYKLNKKKRVYRRVRN